MRATMDSKRPPCQGSHQRPPSQPVDEPDAQMPEATTKLVPAAPRSRRSPVATTIQVSASSTARWITAAGPGASHTAMTMYPEMGMTYWLEKAEAEATNLRT
jgi:hypothetical protein